MGGTNGGVTIAETPRSAHASPERSVSQRLNDPLGENTDYGRPLAARIEQPLIVVVWMAPRPRVAGAAL